MSIIGVSMQQRESIWELCSFCSIFYHPKTALKNKVYSLKNKTALLYIKGKQKAQIPLPNNSSQNPSLHRELMNY